MSRHIINPTKKALPHLTTTHKPLRPSLQTPLPQAQRPATRNYWDLSTRNTSAALLVNSVDASLDSR